MATVPPPRADLTPLFILLLIFILAGLGSIRRYSAQAPPSRSERVETAVEARQQPSSGGGCMLPTPYNIQGKLGSTDYTVSVDKFLDARHAYWYTSQLRNRRINNFVTLRNGIWHVCVGRYWKREIAERRKVDLLKLGYINATVLPPESDTPPPPPPQGGCY